ncbi:MAG: transposase [Acidithiobacillus sp.]|jgi:IS605 OrfB family transposase|uniref:RNA-guided endonuclease InsQ/TnpB family protein n=1 Tax=Acidithiobacillus sp. TaxID=1872118 RepID=UPI00355DF36C
MIRSSKHILKYQTKLKTNILDQIFVDYKNDLEYYIDLILSNKLPLKIRLSTKLLPTNIIKHSQWKQIIYQNASQIIRSQINKTNITRYNCYKKCYAKAIKKNRFKKFTFKKFSQLRLKDIKQSRFFTKPTIKNITITLDYRLINFKNDSKYFNEFIRIRSPYFHASRKLAISINIPFKHHKHSNKFNDWNRKNSVQLSKINGNYYLTLFYQKEEPAKKQQGNVLGIDQGYKKLLTCSDSKVLGKEMLELYSKISRKQQGSKAFKKYLTHRNNEINRICNTLELNDVKELVIENLKYVKHKSYQNNKMNSKVMNKVQRWSYHKTAMKLQRLCQENGILLTRVNPAYTSQKCSSCGHVDKKNRLLEKFECQHCGYINDADINASINISRMRAYSPHSLKKAG